MNWCLVPYRPTEEYVDFKTATSMFEGTNRAVQGGYHTAIRRLLPDLVTYGRK